MFRKLSIWQYLDRLSSDKPVPGGGGTSALVASLGAALGVMVARIVAKRTKNASALKQIKVLAARLEKLQNRFEKIIDTDPAVYAALMKTYRTTRQLQDRDAAKKKIDRALEKSFRIQQNLASEISQARKMVESIDRLSTGSIANDLRVASSLLRGAWFGAYYTARINVDYIHNPVLKRSLTRLLHKTPKV